MSKLTGKVAVVTGASKGIGAAIAKTLASHGAAVVVTYASSKAGAEAVVEAITGAGGRAIAVQGDVSKAEQAKAVVDAAIAAYGRLDILVNNAGVYEFGPLEAVTEAQFHTMFDINVLGLLLVTQAAAPISPKAAASSTSAPASPRSRRRKQRSTPPPRARWTRSPACWPTSLARARSE